jgi:hypothetical protein
MSSQSPRKRSSSSSDVCTQEARYSTTARARNRVLEKEGERGFALPQTVDEGVETLLGRLSLEPALDARRVQLEHRRPVDHPEELTR